MNRIVCIGNRYVHGDDLGLRVYDQLAARALLNDVQVIDGGVAGLNLLPFFDGCECLVFVDCIGSSETSGEVIVLSGDDLYTDETTYGHAAGLGYMLRAERAARIGRAPRTYIVGAGLDATDDIVAAVTERCIYIALQGA